MLYTLRPARLNAHYLILPCTEHQKAYVLLKYVSLENIHRKIFAGQFVSILPLNIFISIEELAGAL